MLTSGLHCSTGAAEIHHMGTRTPLDTFTGVFIPRPVLDDQRLTPASRILFGSLDGLARTEAGCWASSAYLGRICGVKPRQIRNLLNLLEGFGYIERTHARGGKRAIWTVTTRALEDVKRTAMDCRGGRQLIATNRIEDKTQYPPTPLKGGKRVCVRRRSMKVSREDYARGF